jgi:hypothetical protein
MKSEDFIHEFFTPEQIERARKQRKPKSASETMIQLSFPQRFEAVSRAEHESKIRDELTRKGDLK